MSFIAVFLTTLLDIFFLIFQSLVIFLGINKLWPQRSDKHVISSISLTSSACTALNYGFALLNSIKTSEYTELYLVLIYLIGSLFCTTVAAALWLLTPLFGGFFKGALNIWRRELTQLFRMPKMLLTNINQRRYFTEVLMRTAWIDGELHKKEVAILKNMFASSGIDFDEKQLYGYREAEITARYQKIHQAIDNFFRSNPTEQQAVDLRDYVTSLVKIDLSITKEEESLLHQLNQRFTLYLLNCCDNKISSYRLILVPTQHLTKTIIKENFQNLKLIDYFGIAVFAIDTFYNEDYAEEVASAYRQQGLPVYVFHPWELEPITG